ncbi:MAG: hypothetical protein H0U98_03390 [Alphaproteobacteria bacterium]|nr:hypothetical protein [Alphaproteobacteria bacterium]
MKNIAIRKRRAPNHLALWGAISLCLAVTEAQAAYPGQPIAVHGDSTAIGSRIPLLEKYWNIFPQLDGARWWNQLSQSYRPARPVFNDGVGGQSIVTMRRKMEQDVLHRRDTTIIYDRRNDGENANSYVENLAAALATLATDHFLIMPQVPRADAESPQDLAVLKKIDGLVSARWPHNSFSGPERQRFLAALAFLDTRDDGLHRNRKGQAIEARLIKAWLNARGW